MTERGLPIVDGAPACPFVAFEDDRDERAAAPDHRHRCYAEAQPAPRALAHQEAYCLASAFPVCPTFQDWARREAARARGDTAEPFDSVAAAATARSSQRNPPRSWAAPPPWSSRQGPGSRPEEGDWVGESAAHGDAGAAAGVPQGGRGLSGSYADRVASGPDGPGMGGEPAYEPDPEWLPEPEPDPDEDERLPVGDVPPYAPPVASPRASRDEPARRDEPRQAYAQEPASRGDWEDDEEDADDGQPEPPRRRRERDPERVAALGGGAVRGGGGGGRGQARSDRAGDRRRRESDAPEWERARPMEAYPTLRSRRLPELAIPPILVAVVALALAAAVLFALPGLLGFGGPSAGGTSGPTTPLHTPLVSAAPTPIPQATDQTYVVQAGDTLSRIAGRFGITLEELIAANAETLPDPDLLQIGDQLIIPGETPDELPAASEIPAAQ